MITYVIETLYHFCCGECGGWWAIGDPPDKHEWICPHCGHRSYTKEQQIGIYNVGGITANPDASESLAD
jgi:DNA-directed RNA polymerase subunit RPC12/RpoP